MILIASNQGRTQVDATPEGNQATLGTVPVSTKQCIPVLLGIPLPEKATTCVVGYICCSSLLKITPEMCDGRMDVWPYGLTEGQAAIVALS